MAFGVSGLAVLLGLFQNPMWLSPDTWPLSHRPPAELTTLELDAPLDVGPAEAEPPDLEGVRIPVTLNGPVRQWIDFFEGRGRRIYAGWYARMGAYAPLMVPILEREGLPPELIYVCMIESGFNPDAVSKAAAVGPWQFVKRTGGAVGLRYDDYVDARRDPIAATEAAARLFKALYARFGNWPLVLAAYNAGEGAVGKAIRRANSSDFWVLAEQGVLPVEATRYVPKVMAAIVVGRSPARHGFGSIEQDAALDYAEVPVAGSTDLRALARRADLPTGALEKLNPELKRGFTPPGADHPLRVPVAAEAALRASLTRNPLRPMLLVEHRVRFGERLWDVARAYGTTTRDLVRLNGLGTGQPEPGTVLVAPKPDGEPRSPLDGDLLVVQDQPIRFKAEGLSPVYFPVRRSMQVADVAAFFGVAPGVLGMWNGIDPTVPLQRGMVVRVFVPESFDRSTVLLARPDQVTVVAAGTDAAKNALNHASQPRTAAVSRVTHTVKGGENLGSIARRYKVTVAALRAENGMPDSVVLSPGDTVWVPVAEAPRARGAARTRAPKVETRGTKRTRTSRRARRTHKVVRGDTLLRVANKYNVEVDDLAKKNGMKSDGVLRLGASLKIP